MLKSFKPLILAVLLGACVPAQMPTTQSPSANTPSRFVKGVEYRATISKVSDGDTVQAIDGNGMKHKIRLAFIDAPETKQKHGEVSRDALQSLLNGQSVRIKIVDIDHYQREVGQIFLGTQDVNYHQVKNGNAWHYQSLAKRNQDPAEYQNYHAAEQNARQQRIGLWQHARPLAPWDYRKQQRARQANTQNTDNPNEE